LLKYLALSLKLVQRPVAVLSKTNLEDRYGLNNRLKIYHWANA